MHFYQFKKNPKDFVVEEVLHENPLWEGKFIYVFIEKKRKTTFDIVFYLAWELGVSKNEIGIAGLKDKYWITRQWISVHNKHLKSKQKEKQIEKILSKKVKVLDVTYGKQNLQIKDNWWNKFKITFRRLFEYDTKTLNATRKALERIRKKWFANYFGKQRFGDKNNNWKVWRDVLLGKINKSKLSKTSKKEIKFKIQAYASFLFNSYLSFREDRHKVHKEIEWDILKDGIPTWPVFGYDLELPEWKAYKLEEKTLNKNWLDWTILDKFKQYEIYWLRRKVFVHSENLEYELDSKWNLYASFFLPSGSYASSFFYELEKQIEKYLKKR